MEWLALGVAGGAVLLFLIPQLVKEINRPRRKRRKATSPPTGTTPAPASAQIDQPHTPGRDCGGN